MLVGLWMWLQGVGNWAGEVARESFTRFPSEKKALPGSLVG